MFTCGLCFNLLQDPITIECGDTFCLACLRNYMERHTAAEGVVCIMCQRHNRNIKSTNLTNYRNLEIAQRVKELGSPANDVPRCDWCEDQLASQYCSTCNYSLCPECVVAVHKNSAKRGHTTTPIQEGRRPAAGYRKCAQKGHEEFRAEFFCIKCQVTVCVYCLQTGVHRGHDNITVSDAAADVRQQLTRQVEEVLHVKSRMDGVVQELNRVTQFYEETYDQVEQSITDRFALYQQQLLKKEAEMREMLQALRTNGDHTISDTRREVLKHVDKVNEAIARGRRLQSSGSDGDVLENRIVLNVFQRVEMPVVAGTGFRFTDPGDLNLAGLALNLDVRVIVPNLAAVGGGPGTVPMMGGGGAFQPPQHPLGAAGSSLHGGSAMPTPNASIRRRKQQLTFPEDPEVEMREVQDGVLFRCVDGALSRQIGMRAKEHFIDGVNTWKVRLDRLGEGGIGIMCVGGTTEVPPGEAFVWRPGKQSSEGRLGIASELVSRHPITRPGDIMKLTYDAEKKQLRVAHNGIERGALLSNIQGYVTPCFIFNPGECVTLLQ